MKSSLKTLARIQKFNIDEQRKKLNEQLAAEEKIVAGLQHLAKQFEAEKAFAREHENVGDFGAYVQRYLEQKENLEQALAMVRLKIAEIRDVIADMFKEQKTYEIVDKIGKSARQKKKNIKRSRPLMKSEPITILNIRNNKF